jgi:hypothetical protein
MSIRLPRRAQGAGRRVQVLGAFLLSQLVCHVDEVRL